LTWSFWTSSTAKPEQVGRALRILFVIALFAAAFGFERTS
jgi:hypothetical protein